MPIFFLKNVQKLATRTDRVQSFSELMKKARPEPAPEVVYGSRTPPEEKSLINKASIRPKHIEDETISYKSSGYVKDLIEEEH